ncbi:endonuclease V-like [Mytilus galloprovincialis]|uniref:endonuclease V-like n=1 Tax=Mytilus galloprovincialis TaxID=29158 RepID=UPI003F7C2453
MNDSGSTVDRQEEQQSQIPDEIKDKWEREQMKLKKQMVLTDSSDITKIISCCQGKTSDNFLIGGVDISFVKGDHVNACAALIVLNFPQLEVVYEDCQMIKLTAPYIPGFLAFREAYLLEEMYNKLKKTQPQYVPQVIMVDGNGILHPRGFGLACHLGVLLDTPCIGVAKNLFQVDGIENDDDHQLKIKQLSKGGDTFKLVGTSCKVLGKALRSCDSAPNPIYISTGHKITLDSAVELVYKCCKQRVPEPTRQADIKSREYLRVSFGSEHEEQKNKGKKKQRTKTTKHSNSECNPVDNVEELFEDTCCLFDGENT